MSKETKTLLDDVMARRDAAIRQNERLKIARMILLGVKKGKEGNPDYNREVANALVDLAAIIAAMP